MKKIIKSMFALFYLAAIPSIEAMNNQLTTSEQPAKKKRRIEESKQMARTEPKKISKMTNAEQLSVVHSLLYGKNKLPRALVNYIKNEFLKKEVKNSIIFKSSYCEGMRFSDNSNFLAAGPNLINLATCQLSKTIPFHLARFVALPNNKFCVVAGATPDKHELALSTYNTNQITLLEKSQGAYPFFNVHIKDNKLIAYWANVVKVVHDMTGKSISWGHLVHLLKIGRSTQQPMAVSQNEQWLAHCGHSKDDVNLIKLGIEKIDVSKQAISLKKNGLLPADASNLEFHFQDNKLWVLLDKGVYIINPETKKCEASKLFEQPTNYVLSPDGKKIAYDTIDGAIFVENIFDNKERLKISSNGQKEFAVNMDGTVVARVDASEHSEDYSDQLILYETIANCIERARKEGIRQILEQNRQNEKNREKQLFEQFKAQQKASSPHTGIINHLIAVGSNKKGS